MRTENKVGMTIEDLAGTMTEGTIEDLAIVGQTDMKTEVPDVTMKEETIEDTMTEEMDDTMIVEKEDTTIVEGLDAEMTEVMVEIVTMIEEMTDMVVAAVVVVVVAGTDMMIEEDLMIETV